MAELMHQLRGERRDQLALDVFELLSSLGDFATFKELMLAYRREAAQAPGSAPCIECVKMKLHREAQEDGDLRPDLDTGLLISPAASLSTPHMLPTLQAA
eukprot:358619-Chlamydomonas_euryale.AAC.6